jgi:hypothetical protein
MPLMFNCTFQDVTTYYAPLLADEKVNKRITLADKISDNQSKIADKNSKIQDLQFGIRAVESDIRSIEYEISALPFSKQYKAESKRAKIANKRERIASKQSRIEEIQSLIIPSIMQEIEVLESEIANLDKRYEDKLQAYIDNFNTLQCSIINDKWYKIPYGTSVSIIGLNLIFYYLGKEIEVLESTKDDCESLEVTNIINSSGGNYYTNQSITMSNISKVGNYSTLIGEIMFN